MSRAQLSPRYLVASVLAFALVLAVLAAPSPAAGSTSLAERVDLAELPEVELPAGLAELADLGELSYETLIYRTAGVLPELEQPLDHAAPVPEDSVGIGPGSTLITNFYDPVDDATYTGICTAAFIFRDVDSGTVYLGSAGHCFMGETFTSTHGVEADWDPEDTVRIRVCVEDCIGGASGLVSAAEGVYPGATRELGELVYARQNTDGSGVGHDFGIVEIPEDLWGEIRTDMPMWGGPNGAETPRVEQGDPVVHYGNGVALGEVVPTKGRGGPGATSTDNAWYATSAASPGDSGSGVNIGSIGPDGVIHGETAAGVLTHLVIGATGGVIAGTNTARAIEMAAQDAGIDLELIYDVAQLDGDDDGDGDGNGPGDDPAEPLEASIEAPDHARAGTQITFDGSASTGDITRWEWDMGDGTVYEGEGLASVTHRYERPGPKHVVLTVVDEDGATATATHRVRIQGPPAPE